jgi:hypothetical protein
METVLPRPGPLQRQGHILVSAAMALKTRPPNAGSSHSRREENRHRGRGVTETMSLRRRLAIAAPARRSPRSIMASNLASMPAGKPRQ